MYGINDRLLLWISSFLSNRSFKVRVNGEMSNNFDVDRGLPQGSVICPLLFNILVSDITKGISSATIYVYADDIAFWIPCKKLKLLENKLQSCINTLYEWT